MRQKIFNFYQFRTCIKTIVLMSAFLLLLPSSNSFSDESLTSEQLLAKIQVLRNKLENNSNLIAQLHQHLSELSSLPGEVGPQGPNGPQGAPGDPGATGADGEQGPTGDQGPQGIPGEAGSDGNKGPKGEKGPNGTNGTNGNVGPRGPAAECRLRAYSARHIRNQPWVIDPNTMTSCPNTFTRVSHKRTIGSAGRGIGAEEGYMLCCK